MEHTLHNTTLPTTPQQVVLRCPRPSQLGNVRCFSVYGKRRTLCKLFRTHGYCSKDLKQKESHINDVIFPISCIVGVQQKTGSRSRSGVAAHFDVFLPVLGTVSAGRNSPTWFDGEVDASWTLRTILCPIRNGHEPLRN